ncbi:MAG: hypothetical protein LBN33_00250 [Desulfovibrio sp.]|nr:hypothetical protein [Desulfovibrio sp.]
MAATFGLSSFFLSVWLFSGLALPLLLSAALTFCTVAAGFFAVKKSTAAFTNIMAPRWDLPFRMLTATTLVLLLTMLSERLGPRWVGLLSTFPVFITVMSIFSHALYGLSEVNRFERGVIAGSFSYIIFFLLVALLLPTCNMLLVYLGASLAAVALNFSLLQLLTRVKAA